MEQDNRTISQRLKDAIRSFDALCETPIILPGVDNALKRQKEIYECIKEFTLLKILTKRLGIFSDNEALDEINVKYIPFFSLDYYLGTLFGMYLYDTKDSLPEEQLSDPSEFKEKNVKISKDYMLSFLNALNSLDVFLSKDQSNLLERIADAEEPSYEIFNIGMSAAEQRASKIENYKLEKAIQSRLESLNQANMSRSSSSILFDDELMRSIYIDELKLLTIKAFNSLSSIFMELEVLKKRIPMLKNKDTEMKEAKKKNKMGYSLKVEYAPYSGNTKPSDVLSKQGKILRPFTILPSRIEMRDKVFGTGQVLPSMTVEEYLDYELAHGKMLKPEVKNENESDSEDNSDDELEKRLWDDWKDENPKGSGNMKGNLG